MSEQPEINIQWEEADSNKWWLRLLPIERTGKKFTVQPKRLRNWLVGSVLVISTVQIVSDSRLASSTSKSSIGSPDNVSEVTIQNIPAAALQDMQSLVNTKNRVPPKAVKISGIEVIARPKNLASIPPGSMMEAKLISGASNGLVRAQVSKTLYANGDVLIPEGSFLVGMGSSSEDRLFIRFNQVVFKDGTFGSLNAEACDKSDKIVGLKGSKVGNKSLQLTGSLGLGFLGGFATVLQDTEGQRGTVITKPSLKNALLNGTATAALEESKNMMSDLKNRVPIIEVREGTSICVINVGGS